MGIAPCKNKLCQAIWTTTQSKHAPKMAFKFKMRHTHHPAVNEHWLPLEEAYELQFWHVFRVSYIRGSYIHHAIQFYFILFWKKPRCSLATPTWYLWHCVRQIFSKCWNNNIFVPTPSSQRWLLHASGHSKQMLIIMSSNALVIKSCMKIPSSLDDYTPRQ